MRYKARGVNRAMAAYVERNRPHETRGVERPASTVIVPPKVTATDRRKVLVGLPKVYYGTDGVGEGWALEKGNPGARKTTKKATVKVQGIASGPAPYVAPMITRIGVKMDWLAGE